MDQVAALHWIRDNIGSFGGAPDDITVMGSRKSAIHVSLLMLSPLARGKFCLSCLSICRFPSLIVCVCVSER